MMEKPYVQCFYAVLMMSMEGSFIAVCVCWCVSPYCLWDYSSMGILVRFKIGKIDNKHYYHMEKILSRLTCSQLTQHRISLNISHLNPKWMSHNFYLWCRKHCANWKSCANGIIFRKCIVPSIKMQAAAETIKEYLKFFFTHKCQVLLF